MQAGQLLLSCLLKAVTLYSFSKNSQQAIDLYKIAYIDVQRQCVCDGRLGAVLVRGPLSLSPKMELCEGKCIYST